MKKGSLQLSINAIVILIMAIAMLGVGIFFINSVQKSAGGFLEIPDVARNEFTQSLRETDEKIAFFGVTDGLKLSIPNGDEKQATVLVLNELESSRTFNITVVESQGEQDVEAGEDPFLGITTDYFMQPITIDVNDVAEFPIIFESSTNRGRVYYKIIVHDLGDDGEVGGSADSMYAEKNLMVQVN